MAGFATRLLAQGLRRVCRGLSPKKNISLLTLDDGGDGAVAVQNIQQLNATYNPLFYAGVYGNGPAKLPLESNTLTLECLPIHSTDELPFS